MEKDDPLWRPLMGVAERSKSGSHKKEIIAMVWTCRVKRR